MTIVSALVGPASADSWWDCTFVYRSEVSVSATGTATNYPVQVTLQSADFHSSYSFSDNGSDIRVVDGDDNTPLDFFIDEWNVAERQAVLSINVPLLSIATSNLYIYYGNSAVSSSYHQHQSVSSAESTFVESGWRMHTRFTNSDPSSEAAARVLFNGIDDGTNGYGCTVIDSLNGRNNRNTFSGRNGSYGLLNEVYFLVDIPGTWEFRLGSDYGRGGGLYVDGKALDERWNTDLWWGRNWNNPDVLSGSIHLENGYHHIEALGYESCCDGTINMQYKTPGSAIWLDMDTANLQLYGRSCPPGVIDSGLVSVATPSYYTGSIFYDNGSGGSPHDGVRDSAESGAEAVDVSVTVVATGSNQVDSTDSEGRWSVCFLNEAAGSEIDIVASLPADALAVSETSVLVNSESAVNGRVTFNVLTEANYDNTHIGIVTKPELVSDRVLSLVANSSGSITHSYIATTTAELSFQISSTLHQPDQAFSYLAYRDANCDGVADQSTLSLSNPVSVVAGDVVCIVIEVDAGVTVDSSSALTLRVDAATRIDDLDISFQSTNVDKITGLPVSELTLEKFVCNLSRSVCNEAAGDFSYYNAGLPGESLRYRVSFVAANESVSEVTITDSIPAYTTLEPLSISMQSTPSGVECNLTSPLNQSMSDYKGDIEWTCDGIVNPLEPGVFYFTVTVD